MGKVRKIDWSPAEWLAGTRGTLTMKQLAVYDTVLNLIYDRGGRCPNDANFIAGHFKLDEHETTIGIGRSVRASLSRLIGLGKLRLSNDEQWLTNGRADAELHKASNRIDDAATAGRASGLARRRRPSADLPRTSREPHADPVRKSSHTNGLVRTRVPIITTTTNHTHGDTSTDAAREPSPEPQAAPARARTEPEPERRPAPSPSPETKARLDELAKAARRKLMGDT